MTLSNLDAAVTLGRPDQPTRALLEKLSRRDDLTGEERDALDPIVDTLCVHPAGSDILRAGAWPETSQLMVSGLAARVNGLEEWQ